MKSPLSSRFSRLSNQNESRDLGRRMNQGATASSLGSSGLSFARSLGAALASLRLTVALLLLSLVMIFVATLDQVHLGVWGVQKKYFHAFLVMARIPGSDLSQIGRASCRERG